MGAMGGFGWTRLRHGASARQARLDLLGLAFSRRGKRRIEELVKKSQKVYRFFTDGHVGNQKRGVSYRYLPLEWAFFSLPAFGKGFWRGKLEKAASGLRNAACRAWTRSGRGVESVAFLFIT